MQATDEDQEPSSVLDRIVPCMPKVNASDHGVLSVEYGVQVKQRNTPDPGVPFGPEGIKRSACQLPDGASTAFFWDDNTAPKSVVARLASDGPGRWEWSGSFALPEKEDYVGLRMHHTDAMGVRDGQTVILPVSIAVDASKVVLISFKARQNLPPYKIRNSCAAVDVIVSQQVDSVRVCLRCSPPRFSATLYPDSLH